LERPSLEASPSGRPLSAPIGRRSRAVPRARRVIRRDAARRTHSGPPAATAPSVSDLGHVVTSEPCGKLLDMVKIPKAVIAASEAQHEAQVVYRRELAKELDKLEELTKRLEKTRTAWEESIFKVVVYGGSMRATAMLAGVSHGTVSNIVRRLADEPDGRTCAPIKVESE
jgi:hypothetical protein